MDLMDFKMPFFGPKTYQKFKNVEMRIFGPSLDLPFIFSSDGRSIVFDIPEFILKKRIDVL